MAWSSPIIHRFDTINFPSFSHDTDLLISPVLYAAGWQRDCIAIGICVPTEFCRATPGRWLTSFVERLADRGILRGSAALLKDCRLHTSVFHFFSADLEKAYLKEIH